MIANQWLVIEIIMINKVITLKPSKYTGSFSIKAFLD